MRLNQELRPLLASLLPSVLALAGFPSGAAAQPQEPPIQIESFDPQAGGIGARLTVTLKNVPETPPDTSTWVIHLDGLPLHGVTPDGPLSADWKLQFTLDRTGESQATWDKLLHPLSFDRRVSLGLGPADTAAVVGPDAGKYSLTVIPKRSAFALAVAYVALIVLVFALGANSDLLREPGEKPVNGKKPFSLGTTQMAVWFVVILGSFLFIGLVTLSFFGVMSGQALALLGISSATALGARSIDANKLLKRARSQGELDSLRHELPRLKAGSTDADQQAHLCVVSCQKRIAELTSELHALPSRAPRTSKGFCRDLINDQDGVSLHRLQIVVWTVVLAGVFVASVLRSFVMPELDATLLALMGVSAGTYLGFKFPEQK